MNDHEALIMRQDVMWRLFHTVDLGMRVALAHVTAQLALKLVGVRMWLVHARG